jgi:hypothetical protein
MIFCDFRQFSAKKLVFFFSKTNVMIIFLHNLVLFLAKNANFFAEFFGENILKIITSVPGPTSLRWSRSRSMPIHSPHQIVAGKIVAEN